MKKFLDKAADFILEHCRENSLRTAIIFPNKRTEIFLKDYLKQKVTDDFWLPEFYTTDEFLVRASGLQKLDPILLYFELFNIHREIAGADAREIDDFLVWAPVMLFDFNDIDLSMANAEAVFTNLSEAKAMEAWNPDGRELTELQKNYLNFFRSLNVYYTQLNKSLDEKNAAYTGRMYRQLAENMTSLSKTWPWESFVVVGLNALSNAEKQVFTYLKKHFQLDFLWDVDAYYLHPKQFGLKQMGAGRFINDLFAEWQIEDPKWLGHFLADDKKDIRFVGVPKRIGQVKYAGQLLETVLSEKQGPEMDTALVLADEKMLIPMLNALPGGEDSDANKLQFNVTMGYPLANGPLNSFTMQWLNLLIAKQTGERNGVSVLHLNALFNNPIAKIIAGRAVNTVRWVNALSERNSPYLPAEEIADLLNPLSDATSRTLIQLLLRNCREANEFTETYIEFLQLAKPILLADDNKQLLLKEQFSATVLLMKNIRMLVSESDVHINLKALQKILLQLARRNEINLKGEPLSGIQIMGMLETRNLDFKNIILLSANEGILPKSTLAESFIPFDIRSQFKLPLPKEKIDVFAYHFYRLLQRAKNITFIYNAEADELGGGEKSRFLLQLQNELALINNKLHISDELLHIDLKDQVNEDRIVIEKTPDVLAMIHERTAFGFSPSALNSYIQCPLQYYFSKILRLKPPERIDESIENNTFGTIIHEVLEQIYKPFTGGLIKPDLLLNSTKSIVGLLADSFNKNLNNADFSTGKNLLSFEVAKKYLIQFVEADARKLKTAPRVLIGLEKELSATLDVADKEVSLRGTIDRIDKDTNSSILLTDYKTGKVEKTDLKLKDLDALATEPKLSKVLQLLFYTYLYQQNNPSTGKILPGIFSFRNISGGFVTMTLPEETALKEIISKFEEVLVEIISEIFNPEIPFVQTEDEKACNLCAFKGICNREGASFY